MKKAVYWLLAISLLALLGGCSGGGDDNTDVNVGPLTVALFAAAPDHGFASISNPLRVTLTWNITGGKAPYYYALDWNNDGQFDFYLNQVYNKTYSVIHDYYPIGATPYQAILRVTDSDNSVLTSSPVTVTLTTSQGLAVDPAASYLDNDINPNNTPPAVDTQFPTGTPIFFRTAVVNGATPYKYQWDFDEDGNIDSTLEQPQYTFTYNGDGVSTFKVRVIVTDNNDEKTVYDYFVPVKGKDSGTLPIPAFEIILSTNPPDTGTDLASGFKLVNVTFQPGSTNPAVPGEPKLELSVVVNPDPTKSGVPPYEYYWDYENDGAFDSQFQSPTIPYYDDVRKLLVNPYALDAAEVQKTFITRCMVIDGSGKRQVEYRAIVVRKLTAEPGEFAANPSYSVLSGPYAGKPYAEIYDAIPDDPGDPLSLGMNYPETQVSFTASNIMGSSGFYQWRLDIDNDNIPDYPLVDHDGNPATPPQPGWGTVAGTSVSQTVSFGPYGTPPVTDWKPVGYYPVRLYLRAIENPSINPPVVADDLIFDMPVSFVQRPATDDVVGTLKARAGHNVTAAWDNTARQMFIFGGAQGTTPLRDVEDIIQVVDVDPAVADPIVPTAHTWLNFERSGALLFGNQTDGFAFMLGGRNLINGILASMEAQTLADVIGNKAWILYSELAMELGYMPLDQAMGQPNYINEPLWWVTDQYNAGYVILGGLHPPDASDVDEVSSRFISFDPGRPPNLMPAMVAMDGGSRNLPTGRYDGAVVYIEPLHKLYVMGGRVASGQSVATVDVFNFTSGQWEIAPSLNDARSGHVALLVDDGTRPLIYVVGGAYYPPGGAQRTMVATSEVFNPETGIWSRTLPLALPTENGAGIVVPSKETLGLGGESAIWYIGGRDAVNAETNRIQELVYWTP